MSRPADGPPVAAPAVAESFYRDLWRRRAERSRPPRDEVERWGEIERLLARVEPCLAAGAPARVLDLGCGRGWLTRRLADRLPCHRVRGVDPLAASIAAAREEQPELAFEQATASDLLARGEGAGYALIVCSEVLEHVPREAQEAFLSEARALLAPGGHLVLTTPRGELWPGWRRRQDATQPVEDWLREEELDERARRAGLEVLARRRAVPPRRPLTWQGWIDKRVLGRRFVRELPLGRLRRRLQQAAGICQVLLLRRPAGAGADREPPRW